jgi:hypothetical protein
MEKLWLAFQMKNMNWAKGQTVKKKCSSIFVLPAFKTHS